MSIIICDLDGTLCDTTHRQHYMQQQPKDWAAFYAGIATDPVNHWCFNLIRSLELAGHPVVFMSGRPDTYRAVTTKWLSRYDLGHRYLYMRTAGDHRPDAIVKGELFTQLCAEHGLLNTDILFCIDDRQCVVDMWRALGLTCLQCAKGDF